MTDHKGILGQVDEKKFFLGVMVLLAIVLGTAVRVFYLSGSAYPMNDGGLFYRMTQDLLAANLRLPRYTTYNLDQIPFAYPPLPFYVMALAQLATKLPLLALFRYVPLAISVITIPAYYLLAGRLFEDRLLRVLALFFFALVPRAYEWFVMGGGITRALGFLFAILALTAIWDLFTKPASGWVILRAISCSAATVLSHPETALFVVIGAVLLFLYHQPSWNKLGRALLVGGGVLLLISPWLYVLYGYHGLTPFLGAGETGHQEWFEIKNIVTLNFGFENSYFLSVYGVFALVAIFLRRDKLTRALYVFLLLGYVLFPRSGPNLLTLVISALAAIGFGELLVVSANTKASPDPLFAGLGVPKARAGLIFMIVYIFISSATYKFIFGRYTLRLTEPVVRTYSWLDEHASQEDLILFYPVVEDNRFWWNDYSMEWFPALTAKRNATTVQGYEWIPDLYDQKVASYIQLWSCLDIGPGCIDAWEEANREKVDFLVIRRTISNADFIHSFQLDGRYQEVNSNDTLVVFHQSGQQE